MDLQTPLKYKAWADDRTLEAVRGIDRTQHAARFDFARQQLNHLVIVEELFRARLSGAPEPHTATNTLPLPALDELVSRLQASNRWLQAHVQALSPQALTETLRFTFVDGRPGSLTREEAIYHLINHGTYHRGAIGHALDLAGAARPADTFTIYVHEAEPERRGPAAA